MRLRYCTYCENPGGAVQNPGELEAISRTPLRYTIRSQDIHRAQDTHERRTRSTLTE